MRLGVSGASGNDVEALLPTDDTHAVTNPPIIIKMISSQYFIRIPCVNKPPGGSIQYKPPGGST